MVDGVIGEQMDEFVCLGCAFSGDGTYTAAIERTMYAGNRMDQV